MFSIQLDNGVFLSRREGFHPLSSLGDFPSLNGFYSSDTSHESESVCLFLKAKTAGVGCIRRELALLLLYFVTPGSKSDGWQIASNFRGAVGVAIKTARLYEIIRAENIRQEDSLFILFQNSLQINQVQEKIQFHFSIISIGTSIHILYNQLLSMISGSNMNVRVSKINKWQACEPRHFQKYSIIHTQTHQYFRRDDFI